jgi:hypothetical protein
MCHQQSYGKPFIFFDTYWIPIRFLLEPSQEDKPYHWVRVHYTRLDIVVSFTTKFVSAIQQIITTNQKDPGQEDPIDHAVFSTLLIAFEEGNFSSSKQMAEPNACFVNYLLQSSTTLFNLLETLEETLPNVPIDKIESVKLALSYAEAQLTKVLQSRP